jgi:hypothetical protein
MLRNYGRDTIAGKLVAHTLYGATSAASPTTFQLWT